MNKMTLKNFILLYLALSCVACSVSRQVTSGETKVEVRTETKYEKDTVYFEIPVYMEKVQTLDTSSVLENKYSKSEASVSGGVLTHNLATKPVKQAVEVEKQIVYRDSLVYVDKIITNTVEVEKEITRWQRFLMSLGSLSIIAAFCAIAYVIYKLFVSPSKLINL